MSDLNISSSRFVTCIIIILKFINFFMIQGCLDHEKNIFIRKGVILRGKWEVSGEPFLLKN